MPTEELLDIARHFQVSIRGKSNRQIAQEINTHLLKWKLRRYLDEMRDYISLLEPCASKRQSHFVSCYDKNRENPEHRNARTKLNQFVQKCQEKFEMYSKLYKSLEEQTNYKGAYRPLGPPV